MFVFERVIVKKPISGQQGALCQCHGRCSTKSVNHRFDCQTANLWSEKKSAQRCFSVTALDSSTGKHLQPSSSESQLTGLLLWYVLFCRLGTA